MSMNQRLPHEIFDLADLDMQMVSKEFITGAPRSKSRRTLRFQDESHLSTQLLGHPVLCEAKLPLICVYQPTIMQWACPVSNRRP